LAGTGIVTPDIKPAVTAAARPGNPKADKKTKAKRVSLDPQPVIDAKVAALKELGIKLTYAGRQWKAGDKTFTSLEFSKYDVDSFKKLFAK